MRDSFRARARSSRRRRRRYGISAGMKSFFRPGSGVGKRYRSRVMALTFCPEREAEAVFQAVVVGVGVEGLAAGPGPSSRRRSGAMTRLQPACLLRATHRRTQERPASRRIEHAGLLQMRAYQGYFASDCLVVEQGWPDHRSPSKEI